METLIHADIFFFITSIAVILLTVALLFIFWHLYKLSRTLRTLAEKIENEAGEYIEASEEFRERVHDHPIVQAVMGTHKKRPRKEKRD
jgi:cell division protein FtsL